MNWVIVMFLFSFSLFFIHVLVCRVLWVIGLLFQSSEDESPCAPEFTNKRVKGWWEELENLTTFSNCIISLGCATKCQYWYRCHWCGIVFFLSPSWRCYAGYAMCKKYCKNWRKKGSLWGYINPNRLIFFFFFPVNVRCQKSELNTNSSKLWLRKAYKCLCAHFSSTHLT